MVDSPKTFHDLIVEIATLDGRSIPPSDDLYIRITALEKRLAAMEAELKAHLEETPNRMSDEAVYRALMEIKFIARAVVAGQELPETRSDLLRRIKSLVKEFEPAGEDG